MTAFQKGDRVRLGDKAALVGTVVKAFKKGRYRVQLDGGKGYINLPGDYLELLPERVDRGLLPEDGMVL